MENVALVKDLSNAFQENIYLVKKRKNEKHFNKLSSYLNRMSMCWFIEKYIYIYW